MGESKQVKVDNWGIFFLQRLKHFFNKTCFCDLTLQFENNVQLKVHRLVINACTEYFQVLEKTCEVINGNCIIMPPDLQAEVILPIVNFMYTGILEFHESNYDQLYVAARLMNMTVLTKLLDAQKVPIPPIPKPINKRMTTTPVTWNLQGKRIAPKTVDPDLPEQLPGRKLPIWKRKSMPQMDYHSNVLSEVAAAKYFKPSLDVTPKPTRFELPDEDYTVFNTSSFDDLSYTSKPLQLPVREKSPPPTPTTSLFEQLKCTESVNKTTTSSPNAEKKVDIQDFKEYLKEQKLRSDFIDNDDSEVLDNDLESFDDNHSVYAKDSQNKSILKNDLSVQHSKRVRFCFEEKENASIKREAEITASAKPGDVSNHTKIITEVLKKYPHLVKKNKNIRLKILAKGSPGKSSGAVTKAPKPPSKVSYMVQSTTVDDTNTQDGQWSCKHCLNPDPLQFDTYYAYRMHLTDVHNEKSDSQMCNICGYISRKQNMLLYHKYVKHNITPPPTHQFPKCNDCSYVALSPVLLNKHQLIHSYSNLLCSECKTLFPNKSALNSHVKLTGHTNKTLNYNYSEDNHSKEAHLDDIKKERKEEDCVISHIEMNELDDSLLTQLDKPKEKIQILSDIKVNTPIAGIPVQPVVNQKPENAQPLEPSSEAESLSNVASGIAASLGLNTIVVLDQFIIPDDGTGSDQSEFILPDITSIQNIQPQVMHGNSALISQTVKENITSTDELVMVLTDNDYNDANNIITPDNNVVVLYSHPVQNQDDQFIQQPNNLMINSSMEILDVSNEYIKPKHCEEESIELIQEELNNPLDTNSVPDKELSEEHDENVNQDMSNLQSEEKDAIAVIEPPMQSENMDIEIIPASSSIISETRFEEPMDIEESHLEINKEIENNSIRHSEAVSTEDTVINDEEYSADEVHHIKLTEEEVALLEQPIEKPTVLENSETSTDQNSTQELNALIENATENQNVMENNEEGMEIDSGKARELCSEINIDSVPADHTVPNCKEDNNDTITQNENIHLELEMLTDNNTTENEINSPEIIESTLTQTTEEIKVNETEILVNGQQPEELNSVSTVVVVQTEESQPRVTNTKISKILDDWDDGDTDSQQSDAQIEKSTNNKNSIKILINDWEEEEES